MQVNLTAERVAQEVRAEMARQRVSQTALAALLDTSQAAVSRRLRGQVPFDIIELEVIAARLGVPVAQFVAPLDVQSPAGAA